MSILEWDTPEVVHRWYAIHCFCMNQTQIGHKSLNFFGNYASVYPRLNFTKTLMYSISCRDFEILIQLQNYIFYRVHGELRFEW